MSMSLLDANAHGGIGEQIEFLDEARYYGRVYDRRDGTKVNPLRQKPVVQKSCDGENGS